MPSKLLPPASTIREEVQGGLIELFRSAAWAREEKLQMQVARGKFLTGLIVWMAFAITLASLGLIFGRDLIERATLGSFPDWFSPFVVIFLLARLIALAAIWKFRRWGVYLFALLECVEVVGGLFVFTSILTFPLRFMIAVPTFLILLAIWYLALRPKWQAFT